jgi:thiamine biosynthesis protein ThiS
MTMELTINGQSHTFGEERLDLTALFTRLALEQPEYAAVIVNGDPVELTQRRKLVLRHGDRVEIRPYLGGG